MRRSSHPPSDPAYYIEDCRIFGQWDDQPSDPAYYIEDYRILWLDGTTHMYEVAKTTKLTNNFGFRHVFSSRHSVATKIGHCIWVARRAISMKQNFRFWRVLGHPPVHRGAICQFPFQWIYYYGMNKSTGKETGKTHLCEDVWTDQNELDLSKTNWTN